MAALRLSDDLIHAYKIAPLIPTAMIEGVRKAILFQPTKLNRQCRHPPVHRRHLDRDSRIVMRKDHVAGEYVADRAGFAYAELLGEWPGGSERE